MRFKVMKNRIMNFIVFIYKILITSINTGKSVMKIKKIFTKVSYFVKT